MDWNSLKQANKKTAWTSNQTIPEIIVLLSKLEDDIAKIDKYVSYCEKKYKKFQFNLQLFMKDDLIKVAKYVENYAVPMGNYKGFHFWGQHLENKKVFLPHGLCIFVHLEKRIL